MIRVIKIAETWETIEAGGDSFELLFRPPSFDARLAESAEYFDFAGAAQVSLAEVVTRRRKARLAAMVTDWRGVIDEAGDAVPFSLAALETLLSQIPAAIPAVVDLLAKHWDSAPPKNSAPPSGDGSAAVKLAAETLG